MKTEEKKKRRFTKVITIAASIAVLAVGSYAITDLIHGSASNRTKLTKDRYIEVDLSGATATGKIRPGGTVALSPVLKNNGDIDATALIRLTVPTVNNSPAYDFDVNRDWTELEDESDPSSGVFVYGYMSSGTELAEIAPGDSTGALVSDGFTMKSEITGAQFKNLTDIDVEVTGFLVDAEAGTDAGDIWRALGE